MAAPLGNQFWKFRSKHGRDKLFGTPILLMQAAEQFFQECDEHPYEKHDFAGKDADEIYRKLPIPYTLTGFCLYIGASEAFWRNFRKNESLSEDFLSVITRIEDIIKTQKFIGAAVGAFNANIISRDLGLADKQENRNVDKEGNDVAAPAINYYHSGAPGDLEIKESEE